jgi:cytochrome P450
MSDFFVAGADTTSVTLSWAMLYLLHNPDVEKKVQEELDLVVGRSRLPTLADRKL